MKTYSSRSAASRRCGHSAAIATGALLLAIGSGCASNAASSTVSESDYGRLTASQTKPVDDARTQLAAARDELARARSSAVNDQHEGELARSDQTAASADKSRAAAETKIGKDSNESGQMQQARDDTSAARKGKEAADARLAYSRKLTTSQAAQISAAERKVDLLTQKVNFAKLQSLDDAAVPAAGKYDRAAAMDRVADAQRAYDRALAEAAKTRGETDTAKAHWQQLAHP